MLNWLVKHKQNDTNCLEKHNVFQQDRFNLVLTLQSHNSHGFIVFLTEPFKHYNNNDYLHSSDPITKVRF